MPRFLADHNFNEDLLDGLARRAVHLEVVLAREVELQRSSDGDLLAWAAQHGFVVLTHDVRTLVPAAQRRVREGQTMPGVVAVPSLLALTAAMESLAIVALCSGDADLANTVLYLPL